jgi:glycosyltransferase involved in cell wall biosynthesis
LSFRKGLWDLARVIASVDPDRFRFVLVGKVMAEAQAMTRSLPPEVQVIGKVPQAELPKVYTGGDVFLFPTIEDGFAVVLAQAKAAGLPIITTPNGAGTDLVRSEQDGWIVPIRDADAMVTRLRWCDANREALARSVESGSRDVRSRSWTEVAADFENIIRARQSMRSEGALVHAG